MSGVEFDQVYLSFFNINFLILSAKSHHAEFASRLLHVDSRSVHPFVGVVVSYTARYLINYTIAVGVCTQKIFMYIMCTTLHIPLHLVLYCIHIYVEFYSLVGFPNRHEQVSWGTRL